VWHRSPATHCSRCCGGKAYTRNRGVVLLSGQAQVGLSQSTCKYAAEYMDTRDSCRCWSAKKCHPRTRRNCHMLPTRSQRGKLFTSGETVRQAMPSVLVFVVEVVVANRPHHRHHVCSQIPLSNTARLLPRVDSAGLLLGENHVPSSESDMSQTPSSATFFVGYWE